MHFICGDVISVENDHWFSALRVRLSRDVSEMFACDMSLAMCVYVLIMFVVTVYLVLQCDWFFSSWDEDVNVPVDEVPAEPVTISGMSEQLLAKAESLGMSPTSSPVSVTACYLCSLLNNSASFASLAA